MEVSCWDYRGNGMDRSDGWMALESEQEGTGEGWIYVKYWANEGAPNREAFCCECHQPRHEDDDVDCTCGFSFYHPPSDDDFKNRELQKILDRLKRSTNSSNQTGPDLTCDGLEGAPLISTGARPFYRIDEIVSSRRDFLQWVQDRLDQHASFSAAMLGIELLSGSELKQTSVRKLIRAFVGVDIGKRLGDLRRLKGHLERLSKFEIKDDEEDTAIADEKAFSKRQRTALLGTSSSANAAFSSEAIARNMIAMSKATRKDRMLEKAKAALRAAAEDEDEDEDEDEVDCSSPGKGKRKA